MSSVLTLIEGAVGPVSEPVEDASIEEGRGGGGAVLEAVSRRVHGEHHVQVFHHLKKNQWAIILRHRTQIAHNRKT